jgi:uncharacterized membrane protein
VTAHVVSGVERHLSDSLPWMSWNLMLALVPWALAVWLFRDRRPIQGQGLVLSLVCLAFLPNAAYVLTDVIHLPRHVRAEPSDAVVLLGVLPLFGVFMAVGFVAYVDSVRRISSWVRDMGSLRRSWPTAVLLHAASTVGIYLGRVHRFNSWDLLDRPYEIGTTAVSAFTRSLPLAGMLVTFGILVVGHSVAVGASRGIGNDLAALRVWIAGRS